MVALNGYIEIVNIYLIIAEDSLDKHLREMSDLLKVDVKSILAAIVGILDNLIKSRVFSVFTEKGNWIKRVSFKYLISEYLIWATKLASHTFSSRVAGMNVFEILVVIVVL